jgi:hypothetical protein
MSNRIERLKQNANPTRRQNWRGASRDKENIDRWSARASQNSEIAPRAKGRADIGGTLTAYSDPPEEHPTGRRMEMRPTDMPPKVSRAVDKAMVDAKHDRNHVGGSHLRNIRREG